MIQKLTFIGLFISFTFYTNAQIQVSTLVQSFDASGGIKVDTEGNIIVANFGESLDNGNGREVWKVTPTGEVSLYANGLAGASGNDFDSQGNLFQSSIQANTVSKITPTGTVSLFADGSDSLSCNVGIVIDDADNLYVCNCCTEFKNTIRKITPDGTSSLFSMSGFFNCPNGITRDGEGNFYVSNFSNGNIIKIKSNGSATVFAQTPGTSISGPSNGHIVWSPQENVLYVASHGSHRIYRLSMDGNLSVFAGTSQRGNADGLALEATFSRPNGLALSLTGDTLYVNSTIPTTNAGGRPLNPSKLRMITGLLGISSVDEPKTEHFKLKLSPNPTKNKVELDLFTNEKTNVSIRLLDVSGRFIKNLATDIFVHQQAIFEYDLANMPKGLYYVQMVNAQQSIIRKIVLQ